MSTDQKQSFAHFVHRHPWRGRGRGLSPVSVNEEGLVYIAMHFTVNNYHPPSDQSSEHLVSRPVEPSAKKSTIELDKEGNLPPDEMLRILNGKIGALTNLVDGLATVVERGYTALLPGRVNPSKIGGDKQMLARPQNSSPEEKSFSKLKFQNIDDLENMLKFLWKDSAISSKDFWTDDGETLIVTNNEIDTIQKDSGISFEVTPI